MYVLLANSTSKRANATNGPWNAISYLLRSRNCASVHGGTNNAFYVRPPYKEAPIGNPRVGHSCFRPIAEIIGIIRVFYP